MSLLELESPIVKKRSLEYGSCGNKVVKHWHWVQNVVGPAYIELVNPKGEETELRYNLYLFFDNKHDGLLLGTNLLYPEKVSVEELSAELEKNGYDTLDNFFSKLRRNMVSDVFVGKAIIAFVAQYSPEFSEILADYRDRWLERKAMKEAERNAEAIKKKAEEERKLAEEQAARRAPYLGWADNMTELRFGRVMSILEAPVIVDGDLMRRRDFIVTRIKGGWVPDVRSNVTSVYGSKWDVKTSRPKTEYRLVKDGMVCKIGKTEYDFASYLYSTKERMARSV